MRPEDRDAASLWDALQAARRLGRYVAGLKRRGDTRTTWIRGRVTGGNVHDHENFEPTRGCVVTVRLPEVLDRRIIELVNELDREPIESQSSRKDSLSSSIRLAPHFGGNGVLHLAQSARAVVRPGEKRSYG